MERSYKTEIMDSPDVPAVTLRRFHRDLRLVHWLTGTADSIVRRLDGARSVIDVGCGDGALLAQIQLKTGAEAMGVDLREQPDSPVPVLQADATCAEIPHADAAFSTLTLHHLTETQAIDLIRNVGRSCRRFIILDLVRHPMPLVLFSMFIGPLLSKGAAADGRLSIRRAYTANEMRDLVVKALAGTGACFKQWVSPYWARQIVEIDYRR